MSERKDTKKKKYGERVKKEWGTDEKGYVDVKEEW
jgi:hypothetical protein